jgi:hypothetical protein
MFAHSLRHSFAAPVEAPLSSERQRCGGGLPRMWRRGALGFGISLAAAAIAVGVIYPVAGEWYVRSRALPELERRLGAKISVGDIEIGFGRAKLTEVEIRNRWMALTIASTTVKISSLHLAVGLLRVRSVAFAGVTGSLSMSDAGAVRAPGRANSTGSRIVSIGLLPEVVQATDVSVQVLRGESASGSSPGVWLLEAASLRWTPDKQQVAAVAVHVKGSEHGIDADFTAASVGGNSGTGTGEMIGGRARLAHGVIVTGDAELRRTEKAGLTIAARGDLEAGGHTPWRIAGTWQADGVSSWVLTSADDRRMTILRNGDDVGFEGALGLRRLRFGHPSLSSAPITNLNVDARLRGTIDLSRRRIALAGSAITVGGAVVELTGWAQRTAIGGTKLDVLLGIPAQPCQTVLEALPPALRQGTMGYVLGGTFAFEARLGFDSASPDATELHGRGGLAGCSVVSSPRDGVAAFRSGFQASVPDGKTWRDGSRVLDLNRASKRFISIGDIAPYVIDSITATEDPTFFEHEGFDPRGFRRAIVENLKAGAFVLGSSSITMQVAKNMLLSGQRTLARKLSELFLAWHLERVLSKDRILEIYLNIIELGPGIYGVGAASQHYFHKHPSELSPREAAFYSAILPAPTYSYRYYCRNRFDDWMNQRLRRALSLTLYSGKLPIEEWEVASVERLAFVPLREPLDACLTRSAYHQPVSPEQGP